MGSKVSDNDQLSELLNGKPFQEVAEQYESNSECFHTLCDEAKQSLSSFDEYSQFYRTCWNSGPTGLVESYLSKNGERMLKNMVLRESTSGSRYYIETADELSARISTFREIGVEDITFQSVVSTIIEHIIDSDDGTHRVYEVADRLLSSVPDELTEGYDLLARARFVAAAETLDGASAGFERHVEDLSESVPDLRPDDPRSGEELLAAADQAPWRKKEKVELCRAGLARVNNPSPETIKRYLYYTARDVPERYRHDHRSRPYRGELQVAVRQFNCYENVFGDTIGADRQRWVRSYRHVAFAELRSSRRWRSQRDPTARPDPSFMGAARHFMQAADQIKPLDTSRYIKYLSSAFRHFAHSVRQPDRQYGPVGGWEMCRQVHQAAIEILISLQEVTDDERITATIQESIALHSFYRHQSSAVIAFERGRLNDVDDEIDEAFDKLERVPVYVGTTTLEELRTAQIGLAHERDWEFDTALSSYETVNTPELDLSDRKALTKIKRELQAGNSTEALTQSKETFGELSTMVSAVQYLTGSEVTAPAIEPPILNNLSGTAPDLKWRFTTVAYTASKIDTNAKEIQDVLEGLIYKL
jgi:hypothetical protein